jgi:hypothetical protein
MSDSYRKTTFSRTAVWKFLLAVTFLELVLAFVSFAIVRAGDGREPVEAADRRHVPES